MPARTDLLHCTALQPPVAPVQRDGVEYSLRAVPLGGYVAFPDDDPKNSEYAPDDPDLLQNRPIPARALVISAGVLANLAFALAVLFTQARCRRHNNHALPFWRFAHTHMFMSCACRRGS
jgi:Peptidase family M50